MNAVPLQDSVLRELRTSEILQNHIFIYSEVHNQTVLLTILWDTGDTSIHGFSWCLIEDIVAIYCDATRLSLHEACQDLNQLGLSVTIDTSDTKNFTFTNL